MTIMRAALGPVMALTAVWISRPELWLGVMLMLGFVSDVFDGILARRWGTATETLRMADSAADTVFYLGVLAALVECDWYALRARLVLLAVLLTLEAARMIFDWMKFRRMASYHSYASKLWGVLLAMTAFAVLCFHGAPWMLTLALAWGIACDVEGLVMSAILPAWTADVKTIPRAVALRRKAMIRL
jgi:phosphatidylglycerophosphate synthase